MMGKNHFYFFLYFSSSSSYVIRLFCRITSSSTTGEGGFCYKSSHHHAVDRPQKFPSLPCITFHRVPADSLMYLPCECVGENARRLEGGGHTLERVIILCIFLNFEVTRRRGVSEVYYIMMIMRASGCIKEQCEIIFTPSPASPPSCMANLSHLSCMLLLEMSEPLCPRAFTVVYFHGG